jgi:hypothetical protein
VASSKITIDRDRASPRWTRFASVGAAGVLLIYTLALTIFAREGFPTSLETGSGFPYLSDQPVGEDGYYMMMVAWNLGSGQGMTANFGETVTGVQPLMTLVLAGVAWVIKAVGGDKWDLARAVILLGGLNVVALAFVVARIARALIAHEADREFAATFCFVSLCLSAYVFRTFTYGLETGLYLLLVAIVIDVAGRSGARERKMSNARALTLGALVGLAGLARIDFGVLAAIAFGLLLLQRRIDFTRAVLAGCVALLITAPWFLWVHSVSGAYMPSSGPAQSALVDSSSAPGRAEAMLAAVAQNMTPWAPLGGGAFAGAVALVSLLVILVALRRRAFPSVLWSWWTAAAFLPVVYFAFFWAAHFYARYTAPLLILATLATACALASVASRLRAPLLGAFILVVLAFNATALFRTLHAGGIGDGHSVTAGYVSREISKDARVGAFQSGVTGYYNENVINLDGKVNSAALAAMREKRVEEYLDAEQISYVIDWRGVLEGLIPRAMAFGDWAPCPKPVGNLETICIMRRAGHAAPAAR